MTSAEAGRPRPRRTLADLNGKSIAYLIDKGVLVPVPGAAGWDPDAGLAAIWDDWVARGAGMDGTREAFAVNAKVRSILKISLVDHPDCVLRAFVGYADGRRVGATLAKKILCGNRAEKSDRRFWDRTVARIAEIQGRPRKLVRTPREVAWERLFDVYPEEIRDRLMAQLRLRRVPPVPTPLPLHVGRVFGLAGERMRVLAATLVLDGCVNRRSAGRRRQLIGYPELFDELIPADAQGDAAAVTEALSGYLDRALARHRPIEQEFWNVKSYSSALNQAESFAVVALGADAHLLTDLLPARQLDEADSREACNQKFRMFARQADDRRALKVEELVARYWDVQVAIENRLHQLEGCMAEMLDRLPKATDLLRRGLRAGFEYEGPVVRPDGSLGRSDQVVGFRFELESTLYLEAHARDPENRTIAARIPYCMDLVSRQRRARQPGNEHDPSAWSRIHIVYESTRPAEAGGEWHEPFWLELYRWWLLHNDKDMSPLVCAERKRRLLAHGLPLLSVPLDGLLAHPVSRRLVARHVLGDDPSDPSRGRIVIPLVELYHAMSYARLILLYGIRFGARFGETQQLRLGPDCFRKHKVGGKWEPYLALKPKGWADFGKFGIDLRISEAIRHLKVFMVALWYGQELDSKGNPTLPVIPFRDVGRNDLEDGRYLFRLRDRLLKKRELLFFVRVLLLGVVDMKTHDGRYLFTTMLGLSGTGYEELGVLLHHLPGTATARKYDLSTVLFGTDAAHRHNARIEAGLIGQVSGG